MNEREKEIARRFFAAFMSYQLGIGMEYTYKKYLEKGADVGAMWHELAQYADKLHAAAMNKLSEQMKPKDLTVQ